MLYKFYSSHVYIIYIYICIYFIYTSTHVYTLIYIYIDVYLEDHPTYLISHETAIWKGSHNPILRGLTITMVINYLQVLG